MFSGVLPGGTAVDSPVTAPTVSSVATRKVQKYIKQYRGGRIIVKYR